MLNRQKRLRERQIGRSSRETVKPSPHNGDSGVWHPVLRRNWRAVVGWVDDPRYARSSTYTKVFELMRSMAGKGTHHVVNRVASLSVLEVQYVGGGIGLRAASGSFLERKFPRRARTFLFLSPP